MLEEMNGSVDLDAGAHRIEVRADGYEPLVLTARIIAGRTTTYRGALVPVTPGPPSAATPAEAPPAPAQNAAPQTFYLIPGCYMGNIPPEQVRLPANCDTSRVITYTP